MKYRVLRPTKDSQIVNGVISWVIVSVVNNRIGSRISGPCKQSVFINTTAVSL